MKQLISGGGIALFIKVCTGLLGYISFVLLARTMSADDFGKFSFGLNAATFLGVVGSAGLHIAIMRWWPEYMAKEDEARAISAFRWGLKITVALSATLGATMAIAAIIVADGYDSAQYLVVAALLVVPLAVGEYVSCTLRGRGSVFWSLFPRDVGWRLVICGVALAWLFGEKEFSATGAMTLNLIPLIIIVGGQLALLMRYLPSGSQNIPASQEQRREWQLVAFPIWLFSVIYAASLYVDVIIIGLYMSPAKAGPYFAVMRTANILQLVHIAVSTVAAPMVARYYHTGQTSELQKMLKIIACIVALPTIMVFLMLVVFGPWLLGLFDKSFIDVYPALVVLGFGYTFHALCGPVSYLLLMSGNEKANLKIIAVGYGIGLLTQIVLIPFLGYLGAAIGSCTGIILWNIWSRHVAIRETGVDPTLLCLFIRRNLAPR